MVLTNNGGEDDQSQHDGRGHHGDKLPLVRRQRVSVRGAVACILLAGGVIVPRDTGGIVCAEIRQRTVFTSGRANFHHSSIAAAD